MPITTDRGSLTFTAPWIQSSCLKKHSKPTRVCFSNFVSLPKSRLLSRNSSSQKPILVTASSSSSSSNVLEKMNPAVKKRVEVLIEIEKQYEELKEKFIEERSDLEAKYLKLYKPLFNKRYEIVNNVKGGGVPNFWLTVLKNNEITGEVINERDEEALKYLKDIKWSKLKKSRGGFKIEFFFDKKKNPYFRKTVLTREYYYDKEYHDCWTKGTSHIKWYPGKRLIPRESEKEFVSFFNFFVSFADGPCEFWSLANRKDRFKTGLTIKHEIISHAVSWFTGEENLSPSVKVLREIQKQYDDLEANYLEEKAALESKYHKLYQPLFTKRYEIVNGVVEVEGAPDVISAQDYAEKGVPDFWLRVLKSGFISMNKRDERALKYLKDIKWSRIEKEQEWCKIEFLFDHKNPYFKNSVLTKTYHMITHENVYHGIKEAIGTEIEWYPRNRLTSNRFESFFDFFSPPCHDEFNVALEYKYKIIPLAVSLFLEDE